MKKTKKQKQKKNNKKIFREQFFETFNWFYLARLTSFLDILENAVKFSSVNGNPSLIKTLFI